MDTMHDLTTNTVDANAPRFDIMKNDSLDDNIVAVTEYQGEAYAYSSDDDVSVSDHPSDDPSDLALAVRDDSFPPVPQMVGRTYSSSEESFGMDGVEDVDVMIYDISRHANTIHEFEKWNVNGGNDELNDEFEDDGYASVEDNIIDNNDIEKTRMFEVTDLVPTTRAQQLFVMAWNGESSSCGEDVGEIETLPSESESGCVEDKDVESEGEGGSFHTLNSFEELEDVNAKNAERMDGMDRAEMDITSSRCITSHGLNSKNSRESYSSAETSPNKTLGDSVTDRKDLTKADETDASEENNIVIQIHFEQNVDTKVSNAKKRKLFKRVKKLFAICFGRQ